MLFCLSAINQLGLITNAQLRFQDLEFKLTGVEGAKVVKDLLA